jgi:hypothetical protein
MNDLALYEFSVLTDDYTRSLFYVVGRDPEEAINKFLDKYPDLDDFCITCWWGIDIP